MRDSSLYEAVLHQQGYGVFEYVGSGLFQLHGAPPKFCTDLFGDDVDYSRPLPLADRCPFLEAFLTEAATVWSAPSSPAIESGLWTEKTASGEELGLEATALCLHGRPLLLVQNAQERYHQQARLMQATRNAGLEHEHLQRETRDRLRRAERMEAMGRLACGVAHDFNNILTVILGLCATALDSLDRTSPARRDIDEIAKAGNRAADITRQLLGFSRKQVITPRAVDLNGYLMKLETMLRRTATEQTELVFALSKSVCPVFIDPSQIDQVVINLTANARDAMPNGGAVTISTTNLSVDEAMCAQNVGLAPGDHVVMAIRDTGSGMDQSTLRNAFVPFFTTKPEGRGTGIGLASVYGIVKQNGGFVKIESEVGRGTQVLVYLPRYGGRQRLTRSAPSRGLSSLAGRETVLLVDDSDAIREVARRLLTRLGYSVLDADRPAVALELCRTHAGPIHLLLTDVVMQQMNGIELVERVKELRPAIATLLMSGYADELASGLDGPEIAGFLPKPFDELSLGRAVRTALNTRVGLI
jgi:signal transduction histidine kinase